MNLVKLMNFEEMNSNKSKKEKEKKDKINYKKEMAVNISIIKQSLNDLFRLMPNLNRKI